MCLSLIEKQYNRTSNRIHVGYKVFYPEPANRLRFEYYWLDVGDRTVPQGQWLKANSLASGPQGVSVIQDGLVNYYKPGFHIYRSDDDVRLAGKGKSTKVFFRNVTAKGSEAQAIWNGSKPQAVIAQEMFVPSEEGQLPPELRKKQSKKKGRNKK